MNNNSAAVLSSLENQELSKFSIAKDEATVSFEGNVQTFPLMELPEKYFSWINNGRKQMYDKIVKNTAGHGFFASHLPVVTTFSKSKLFPFNSSNKGVGFIPKPEYLQEYIDLFRTTMENTKGIPWEESLHKRIECVSQFYFNEDKIDKRVLSTLEIFEKQTFKNLNETPKAAIHYTGNAPDYISFQLNAAVEIIGPEDPRHEFIKLARTMFEYNSFHIYQHNFPYAYLFWISELVDKTPYRVPQKNKKVVNIKSAGGLNWSPEASESINRAPGMIRQFIRQQIEKYATDRGYTEITLDFVREAREVLERNYDEKEKKVKKQNNEDYKHIYVALDSSELANEGVDIAISLGEKMQSQLSGSHVYAAKMHDMRFRSMEGGLPEEFQKEKELNRQRKIHDSLITKGLELITDSYINVMQQKAEKAQLKFNGVSLEGRNWEMLVKDIEEHDYDLVVMGGHGVGRVSNSQLGSVTQRVMRRIKRDLLIVKKKESENLSDLILVCIDGSERSWGALKRGIRFAKSHNKKLKVVSVFDPYFHYVMFNSLNKTLTEKARKVFKFEEQEKLHEEIIDSGLAKIYQSHLNIAAKIAEEEGVEIATQLLDGKPFEKILAEINNLKPWLTIIGRIGYHSDESMDMGSNTDNVARLGDSNILIVETKDKPSVQQQAEETITWTKEATAFMEKVPVMARAVATKSIQNYCIAEGHTVVTESILLQAVKQILPEEALVRMGIIESQKTEEENLDKIALSYKCSTCGHIHHGNRPASCPICGGEGAKFLLIESDTVSNGQTLKVMGDRELIWEKAALDLLNQLPNELDREQIKSKLEKQALTKHQKNIGLKIVEEEIKARGLVVTPPKQDVIWLDEAIARVNRVPEGFMRKAAMQTVVDYAKEAGLNEINLEVAEAGLGKAREKMMGGMASGAGHPSSIQTPAADVAYKCGLCGLAFKENPPSNCPSCNDTNMEKLEGEDAQSLTENDFVSLKWDAAAKEKLSQVPEGIVRNMTKGRAEHWARKHGEKIVTKKVLEDKYSSWAHGASSVDLNMPWNEEATQRGNKIPEFIRPMVKKEIERQAVKMNKSIVDSDVINEVMKNWEGHNGFHHGQ